MKPSLRPIVRASLLLAPMLITDLGAHQAAPARAQDPELLKSRSMAATQHEIAILLLSKGEFAKALTEASKIFSMKWPTDQEPILLKELLFFTDKFLHHEQPSLGIQLLDSGAKTFRTPTSLIAIWKEKGFLYKKMDQTEKALECFREAQRLEQSAK